MFDTEIARLHDSLVSEYEFEKGRNATISSYIGRLSTNSGVADALAHYHTFFEDPGLINSEVERELSVTRQEMREVVQKFLRNDRRVVLFYHPDVKE
jgi:predicted Zn-dependent peptidase